MKNAIKLILAITLFVLPAETWAGKYIKELAIATRGKSNDAINDLTNNGFQVLSYDLNRKAGGNYIYLGYKTTDDPKEAITDIVVVKDDPWGYDRNNPMKSMTYDGKTYYPVPVPAGNDSGDLNRSAGGKNYFFWYTRDKFENGVVASNMYVTTSTWAAGNVNRVYGGGPANLNEGAGGQKIYLNITKQIPTFSSIPQFDEMFDVSDLGGGLYKIDIPLAAVDENQDTYILGYKSTTYFGVYAVDDSGKEKSVLTIFNVKEGKDFTDDWKIAATALQNDITYYEPNNMSEIKGEGVFSAVSDIPVKSSNKVDKVWATFLCKLPAQYSKFRLKGTGTTNYSTNKSLDITIDTYSHSVQAPADINNITVVQPVINMHIDGTGGTMLQPQGSQLVQIVSNNPIEQSMIWDSANEKFFGMETFETPLRNFNLNMESSDETQRYVLLLRGAYSSEMPATGSVTSKPVALYAVPVEILPFHEIHDVKVVATKGIDDKGVFTQKNTITWTIENYRQIDVVENDEMLIQRAHKEDFSDAVTIGNKSFFSGEADPANEDNMIFTYVDEDKEGWYASDKSDNGKVYYRVVRALAYSLWNENCVDKYKQSAGLTLNHQLADVVGINVSKPNAEDVVANNVGNSVSYSFINCQGDFVTENGADHEGHYGDASNNAYVCKYCGVALPGEYDTHDYLSFTAVGGSVTIGMSKIGTPVDYTLQYSADKAEWTTVNLSETNDNIVTIEEGKTYYFRHGTATVLKNISRSQDHHWAFAMKGAGTIEAGGSVMSLLDASCQKTTLSDWPQHAFTGLFKGCELLTVAPKLPATSVGQFCYVNMFEGTGISVAPVLPATRIPDGAYDGMFRNCKNLVTVPQLPATTLLRKAYEEMFSGCEKLKSIEVAKILSITGDKPFNNWLAGTAKDGAGMLYVTDVEHSDSTLTDIPTNWQLASDSERQYVVEKGEGSNEIWDGEVTVRVNLTPASEDYIMWDPAASIVIERYSPAADHYQGHDYAEKTITVSGSDVKWNAEKRQWYAEIEDIQGAAFTHYYYKAHVDASKSNYRLVSSNTVVTSEAEANLCYRETIAPFSKLEATRGTVKGKVALEWEVEDGLIDSFELTRKEYGSTAEAQKLTLKSQKSMSYIDEAAASGKVYEYTVTAKCSLRGKTYVASKTAYGWNPYFATLSGQVQMPDGSLIPGPVTVSVWAKDNKRVTVKECKVGDEVIMPGYDMAYNDSVTTTDGVFTFDNIPYISAGIDYVVKISAYNADFNYAGQEDKQFTVRLNDAVYAKNMNLVCSNTKQVSGRVLYKNSTIPVADCMFYMNGYPVLDANGNAAKTNNKGNFSFLVPVTDMTLQARKEGHVLENDGYIEGINTDILSGDHAFRPSKDYDGLVLSDTTKVRLVGRLIGGSVQGKLPVGLGLTKNNIGDNLKMVLELEGDPAAQILYLEDQPDITSVQKTFAQTVMSDSVSTTVNKTNVSVEKKRIVVTPDVKTGEFCLDLAPAKYKVTELSASGYATLFSDGEGFEVLDLTNDVKPLSLIYNNEKDQTFSTTYNSSYQKVYHSPVRVTYKQSKYGMEQQILGAEKITEMNLKGEKVSATVASYDKAADKVTYMFGYPVFEEGKTYQLIVSAHEDYYYNGDTSTQPDIVHLDAGKLKVRNGLESSLSEQEYELDTLGTAMIEVKAGNTTFNAKEENALRSLTMQVLNNGYYYEAEPLTAYVTGSRDKGKDVVTIDGDITVLDVIRDPYGSRSYAYRDSGTKYHWERQFSAEFSSSLDIKTEIGTSVATNIGVWGGMGGGAYVGTSSGSSSTLSFTVPIPLYDYSYNRIAQYDMTLSNRVETSSETNMVGAKADVYIGTVNTVDVGRRDVFCVIDSATYRRVKAAVDAKSIRIVSEGKDAEGKPFYLAIAEKLDPRMGMPREFIYTQKHITGTVIPNLVQMYKSSILTGTVEEVQQIANATKTVQYRLKDGKTIQDDDCYETISPETEDFDIPAFSPDNCLNMIANWVQVIAANESKKLAAVQSNAVNTKYSLSGGTKVSHSESAQWYDRVQEVHELLNINIDGDKLSDQMGISVKLPTPSKSVGSKNDNTTQSDNGDVGVSLDTPGFKFRFSLKPNVGFDLKDKYSALTTYSGGSGYVLQASDNSYVDIDVYSIAADSVLNGFTDGEWEFVKGEDSQSKANIHDFVYVVRGGAERQPWTAPDSTLYYETGSPLGTRTLRIDNPKIYIDQPVVSNLPASEKAYFSVRITNETELSTGVDITKYTAGKFTLKLDDKSTPDGAVITIDGMPVKAGIPFSLKPGKSIVKTLTVERSGMAYDYDNIVLCLKDDNSTLEDNAQLSVHYLPTSTPLRLTRPVDKWVMNTLSPVDEKGRYYLPVEITDFDVNYANFDHIELQYKKKSEGDTKWVNLCSYYAQEDLYAQASGEKEMIKSGTITYRFYGDADPMEMEYDLRAVSFCRLGSGYVSSSSNVMSGLKDTRLPEVFGKPLPTSGILTYEDVISIPFNEPIAYNYLDETANFRVVGFVNNRTKSYTQSLRFPAGKNKPNIDFTVSDADDVLEKYVNIIMGEDAEWFDVPVTKVKRNLTGRDFTVDAMVKLDSDSANALFFTITDDSKITASQAESYMLFGIMNGCMLASFNGIRFLSEPITADRYKDDNLSLTSDLTQVAMSFKQSQNTEEGEPQVRFYLSGVEVKLDKVIDWQGNEIPMTEPYECNAYGEVSLGCIMAGNMADVRLWNKALTLGELASKHGKTLSGSEPSLMGYWPVDEMNGNVLYDKANGADMHFNRQQWQMSEGQHSLRLDGKGIELQDADDFLRYDYDDFTLSMWIKPDADIDTEADGGVTVFQSGGNLDEKKFRVFIDGDGLKLQTGQNCFSFCENSSLLDNKWHNIVVVANQMLNSAALFFDGEQAQLLSGEDIHGLQSQATIGGDGFRGNIDNLTFWHLAFPTYNCELVQSAVPSGNEMGLVYYLPFERDESNSQGMIQSVFSPYNEVNRYKPDGTLAAKHLAILPQDGGYGAYDDSEYYPSVKTLTGLTNLPFSWTSTGNELQININKNDADINHQQLFVTVSGVEDIAGNSMRNPLMMSVYVDRNVLVWNEKKMDINIPYGKGAEVKASWHNKSGRNISYSIENYDSWITLSNKMGTVQPLGQESVELTISEGLAPGHYVAKVCLVDNSGLSSLLNLDITVIAEEPDLEVVNDPAFCYSMNLIGRMKIVNDGGMEFYDMDRHDIVYAMYNNICVGKAHISVDDELFSSFVNMTVYGNDRMIEDAHHGKKNISFMLWRASTNETSVLLVDGEQNVKFVNNGMIGCPPDQPVIFTLNNDFKQSVTLDKGWNWVSLNIVPRNKSGLNSLFESNDEFTEGDWISVENASSQLLKDKDGIMMWSSGIDTIDNSAKHVYKMYVQKPTKFTVYGNSYNDQTRFVTLTAGKADLPYRWNELPYLLAVNQPVQIAMSDFYKDKAPVGTVIKSLKQFAVMDDNGKWVGSLEYMHPGQGYFVKYLSREDATVYYTNVGVAHKAKAHHAFHVFEEEDESLDLTLTEGCLHAQSMPVIAQVGEDADFREGDIIVAYTNGEVAASAQTTTLEDGRQLFFLSLNAENNDVVRFAHIREGKVMAKSANGVTFHGDVVTGTLKVPYTIDFSAHSADDESVFDISGRRYGNSRNIGNRHGVFIINEKKILK